MCTYLNSPILHCVYIRTYRDTHHFVHKLPGLLHSPAVGSCLLGGAHSILNGIDEAQDPSLARVPAVEGIGHLGAKLAATTEKHRLTRCSENILS